MSLVTPSHQGGSSFAALELLANPARLTEKINQLKAAEESAHEQITLAGPASEILKIREAIDADREEAAQAVQDANGVAEDIRSAAVKEAQGIVNAAEEEAERISSEIKSRAANSEAAGKEAADVLAEAKKEAAYQDERAENLSNDRELMIQAESALEERESILLQEKSKLATVREHIEQFLR